MQEINIQIAREDQIVNIVSKAGFSDPVEDDDRDDNVILLPNAKLPEDIDEGLQHLIETFMDALQGLGYRDVTGVGVELGDTCQWTNPLK